MNSEGEKMPPEAPEPRLVDVAELRGQERQQQPRREQTARQDRLDGRIADALDVIMPGEAKEQIDQDADDSMPMAWRR